MSMLNFNLREKSFFTVILPDEEQTKLFVLSPTKKILDIFISLENTKDKNTGDLDEIDTLYEFVYIVLNRNKNKKVISREKIEELFDTEDIQVLIEEYMKFIENQMQGKN